MLEKLEENLEASGYIDNKDIFLDGFSYFTGRELRILRILLRRAKSVTVTLLGDTQDRELFSESLRVRERLYALARDAGVACEEEILPQGEVRGALDHIERCFFGPARTLAGGTDAGRIHKSRAGVRVCAAAAPVRYIHSPSSVAAAADCEAVLAAARAFLEELGGDDE